MNKIKEDLKLLETIATLDELSLWHSVQVSPGLALAYYENAVIYASDVTNDEVLGLISDINAAIPSGKSRDAHVFYIGREYKTTIYVEYIHAYTPEKSAAECRAVMANVIKLAEKWGCNEVDLVEADSSSAKVRFSFIN